MKFAPAVPRYLRLQFAGIWALLSLVTLLFGCTPLEETEANEQKNAHFIAGRNFRSNLDWDRAIGAFEDALATNPKNASAHWELGLLYENPKTNFAAAIYHYQRFLQLRPESSNASMAKQRIYSCTVELAKSVAAVLAPQSQAQLTGFMAQIEQLSKENTQLKNQLATIASARPPSGLATGPAPTPGQRPPTDQPVTTPGSTRGTGSPTPPPEAPPAQYKNYVIKDGDSLSKIAKEQGLGSNWQVLTNPAINPNLNPNKLTKGRTIKIPIR